MCFEHSRQDHTNKRAELLFRRGAVRPVRHRHLLRPALERMMQGGTVQLLLVAEVVIDGRDVGSRLLADFADGRSLEALLGEDAAGGFEESLLSIIGYFHGTIVLNICFN